MYTCICMETKRKVLIIDDEADFAETIKFYLENSGFEVITAPDGEEGIKKAQELPHIILLDLMMPDTNGWELLSWIRTEAALDTPTIIITAKDEMESIKKSYTLDADHYIIKPVNIKELIKAIETVCSLKGEEHEKRESNTRLK